LIVGTHVPSHRLEALAPSTAALGYLEAVDGFWADLVLAECEFLETRGYPAEWAFFHQNGDSFSFGGRHGSIVFHFFPDGNHIGAEARLSGGLLSFDGELDSLARLQEPRVVLPTKLPLDRETIERNVRFWAGVLRSADKWL
jgi:hypothetical protein